MYIEEDRKKLVFCLEITVSNFIFNIYAQINFPIDGKLQGQFFQCFSENIMSKWESVNLQLTVICCYFIPTFSGKRVSSLTV